MGTTSMNVCKKCKYVEENKLSGLHPKDPMNFSCLYEECVDPVTGNAITCVEARGYETYCGKDGRYYEDAIEEAEVISDTTRIVT
jgi:hypothetical protein